MNPCKYSQLYFNKQFWLQQFCDLLYERKNDHEKYLLNKILENFLCLDC